MIRHAIVLFATSLLIPAAAVQKKSFGVATPPQAAAPLQIAGALFNETTLTVLLVNVSGRTVAQATIGLVLGSRGSVEPAATRIGGACIATVPADGFLVVTNAHNGFDQAVSYFSENDFVNKEVTIGLTQVRFADGTEWIYPLEAKGRFEETKDQAVNDKIRALMEKHFPGRDLSWAFPDPELKGKVSRCRVA